MVGESHFFLGTSLIIKVDRLTLYSGVESVSYAFATFNVQSWILQNHILRASEISDVNSDFDRVLDDLNGTIPYFNLNSFTSKDDTP